MRLRDRLIFLSPFVPLVAGQVLSVWRFRSGDSIGGLAFGEIGMILMLVVACRLPDPGDSPGPT